MRNITRIEVIMIIGILSILFTPLLLTRSIGLFDFTSSEYSNIGSTIGGITAPFASLLGSILVYLALKAQIDANALIQEQLKKQEVTDNESKVVSYLIKQLEIINYDINNLQYKSKTKKTVQGIPTETETILMGSDAIGKYLYVLKTVNRQHGDDFYNEVYQIDSIKQLLILIDDFIKSTLTEEISEKDRYFLTSEIRYQYVTKIKHHFEYYINFKSSSLVKCHICEGFHQGIPDEFYELIDSINLGLNLP